ncbi:phosphoribosylglycinamide formyltransferase [Aureliella helgolandensis]|uniref:Phosphoribosylglycinamide formyltransferase n=1 Tax=Aureliella helgolandensis TaxID=2527968 RepID=A0A518G0A4_9BACT|nr:phosphoribosylglycinamide formyltransferase [Aureliella helgolandensis]QDV22031.1 Phosphoribosylglycinamide formyltransferase [Aureliella helgolandensis]
MQKLRIAVLISGGGTTLKNLIDWQLARELPVDFQLVISSNPDAQGLKHARAASIPTQIVSRKDFATAQEHSARIFDLCQEHDVQLLVMGGYVEHLLIAPEYENRVINIHPSLIPSFCGQGYYGKRVHQRAVEYGVKTSGCTVHFVDNEYDHGPIIAQRACAVYDTDTSDSLQNRVFELECQLLPEAIAAIAEERVEVRGRVVHVHAII